MRLNMYERMNMYVICIIANMTQIKKNNILMSLSSATRFASVLMCLDPGLRKQTCSASWTDFIEVELSLTDRPMLPSGEIYWPDFPTCYPSRI